MDLDPIRRMNALVDLATPREFPSMRISIDKYIQILNNIFQMGVFYAAEGDDEKAFILFLRFVRQVIYLVSIKSSADKMSTPHVSFQSLLQDAKIVFNPSMAEWGISEEKLAPYILCNETSIHPIVFQRVIIPNNLPQSFLKATENKFRFAFLYGKLVRNSLIASHALVASVEDINSEKFERFMADPEAESDLPIIGCICSSLTEVCDTRFFECCSLNEMICIICPEGPHRSFVLHLINMPSNHQRSNHMRDLNFSGCSHLHITDQVAPTMVDHSTGPSTQQPNN